MQALNHPSIQDVVRLKQALKRQNHETLVQVLDKINDGFYVLLRAPESTLTICPDGDALHICQMAGTMKDVPEILESVFRIAKEMKLSSVTLRGRIGWIKVLKPFGFVKDEKYLRYTL